MMLIYTILILRVIIVIFSVNILLKHKLFVPLGESAFNIHLLKFLVEYLKLGTEIINTTFNYVKKIQCDV